MFASRYQICSSLKVLLVVLIAVICVCFSFFYKDNPIKINPNFEDIKNKNMWFVIREKYEQ